MSSADGAADGGTSTDDPGGRVERDLLGERLVPRDVHWGIHTLRALENFPLSGRRVHPELIRGMLAVKAAAAETNRRIGALDGAVAGAIVRACAEIAEGPLFDEIVVDALQGGAGTSLNLNVDEVVANRAEEILGGRRGTASRVDPIAHVNLHQSTNDTFPTALKIAAIRLLGRLEPAIADLQTAFQAQESRWAGVVKMGRTELQDACPIGWGAVFSAWAEALSRDRWRVSKCEERLRVVNLGGTAIGTGIAAPRAYVFQVVDVLRATTGLGLARAENLVDATQNADAFVEVSGILKAHAVDLFKISSDLRLLASGPDAGFAEIRLPAMQAGSSLMPGKVNPVICEAVGQVALKAIGHDSVVTAAAAAGQLELNPFLPLVADALLDMLTILTAACRVFATRCVEGIVVDSERCADLVGRSSAVVTALVGTLGYAQASAVAREARASGRTIAEVVLARGLVDEATLRRLLSAEATTALGRRG
ncbi:aspartate ammonia-lyase [Siculibacillus lacustris]|uniref:Aspartate ammonia-lyase n=1 Tax=Siculibacillus lacustris TaxID=1549641 RepID=A0A4Q9VM37_9HYPH|nr:aspartate ammonia-lyase [Siculibacillus lacustris]TBW36087.1 aspartate ammonia-lyase [Siculibacillus lacustris]